MTGVIDHLAIAADGTYFATIAPICPPGTMCPMYSQIKLQSAAGLEFLDREESRVAGPGENCGGSIGYSCEDGLTCVGMPPAGSGVIGGTGTCKKACDPAKKTSCAGTDECAPRWVAATSAAARSASAAPRD